MRLELTKDQSHMVHRALERLHLALREGLAKSESKDVSSLVTAEMFQLELLITWFDRQRELEG